MERAFGKVHTYAECEDCGWTTDNHKNGQGLAAIHAKKKKHKVKVEIGIAGYYDGREQ